MSGLIVNSLKYMIYMFLYIKIVEKFDLKNLTQKLASEFMNFVFVLVDSFAQNSHMNISQLRLKIRIS